VIGIFRRFRGLGTGSLRLPRLVKAFTPSSKTCNFSGKVTVDFRIRTGSGWASRAFAWNVRLVGAALALALVLAAGDAVRADVDDPCPLGPPAGDPSCQPKFHFKGANTPINTCQTNTSDSPCAWADVIAKPENFLACRLARTGPIALCYYSGVPGAPLMTPSCILSPDKNSAQCDCYKISEDNPKGATYSYVSITSILNKKIYEETVSKCGVDGSKCLNAVNMLKQDPDKPEAPVCAALREKTLFPDADLISDFSPIFNSPTCQTNASLSCYKGTNDPPVMCPTVGDKNLYAGCMTAPCKNTRKIDPSTGLPLVSCTCPIYNGPNQVGNPQINSYSCTPTPYVWSSSYMPPAMPTEP
jgi:hypothetical protein